MDSVKIIIPILLVLGLSACGGGDSSNTQPQNNQPQLDLNLSQNLIPLGGSVGLSWTASNVSSCVASNDWSGNYDITGNITLNQVQTNNTYTLTCDGSNGTVSRSVQVSIQSPQLSISASPQTVSPNTNTSISWSASNATSCIASNGWSGNKQIQGNESRSMGSGNVTFSLSCDGPGGVVNESVTVNVSGGGNNTPVYEGYGAVTTGGAGGEVCTVTNLSDSGPGTLRDCVDNRTLSNGSYVPRIIEFTVGGELQLQSDLKLNKPYLTIDGATAPAPGITITKVNFNDGEVRIDTSGPSSGHDIIVRHIRFDGGWDMQSEAHGQNTGTIGLDGEEAPNAIFNVILDHVSIARATDAAGDMWGDVRNVTYQYCFFYKSLHPITMTYLDGVKQRRNISLHHNVFASNHERNPQVRGNVQNLDYRNNIVYDWKLFPGGYGMRLRERNGVYPTNTNIVNNFFYSSKAQESAFILGSAPGDAPNPYPGNVYIGGNYFPVLNVDSTGTVANEIAIPQDFQVTTQSLPEMVSDMLPIVGMKYRNNEEQQLIDSIATTMNSQLGL